MNVVVHNKRAVHGSLSLVWSEELASEAQKWCEELALNDILEQEDKNLSTTYIKILLQNGSVLKVIVQKW